MKLYLVSAVLLSPLCIATVLHGQPQKYRAKQIVPVFDVDARFPTMPNHMLMGGVGGVTADSHGNVWVFQRPPSTSPITSLVKSVSLKWLARHFPRWRDRRWN